MCDSKKLKFIKKQEARGLMSSLGIKTPFLVFFFVLGVLAIYLIQGIK